MQTGRAGLPTNLALAQSSYVWGCRHAVEVGQHQVSRHWRDAIRQSRKRAQKRAGASSLDQELLVTIWINLECGHLRAAGERYCDRPRSRKKPTWLWTKCQVPVPLYVAPISFFKSAARACATATRASTESNNLRIVVRFICILF